MKKKNEKTRRSERLSTFENFIRQVLADNFDQKVDDEQLRMAAEKLSEALPQEQKAA